MTTITTSPAFTDMIRSMDALAASAGYSAKDVISCLAGLAMIPTDSEPGLTIWSSHVGNITDAVLALEAQGHTVLTVHGLPDGAYGPGEMIYDDTNHKIWISTGIRWVQVHAPSLVPQDRNYGNDYYGSGDSYDGGSGGLSPTETDWYNTYYGKPIPHSPWRFGTIIFDGS